MKQRVLQLTIGDWSDDIRNVTTTNHFEFTGSDVSNEALSSTFHQNIELTGVDPFEFCEHPESDSMWIDDWEKILEAGYESLDSNNAKLPKSLQHPVFYADEVWDSDEGTAYSFAHLLLWYLTNGTDTVWRAVEYEELFAGHNRIIKDMKQGLPGYGLFYT